MFNSDGLHLSPGQTITIPVNDIYEVGIRKRHFINTRSQLRRDYTQCGTRELKQFVTEAYRQSACYWEKV